MMNMFDRRCGQFFTPRHELGSDTLLCHTDANVYNYQQKSTCSLLPTTPSMRACHSLSLLSTSLSTFSVRDFKFGLDFDFSHLLSHCTPARYRRHCRLYITRVQGIPASTLTDWTTDSSSLGTITPRRTRHHLIPSNVDLHLP